MMQLVRRVAVCRLDGMTRKPREFATAVHFGVTLYVEAIDGQRFAVFTDRGFTAGIPCKGEQGNWRHLSAESICESAQFVVGPDDPIPGHPSRGDDGYWETICGALAEQGILETASRLAQLPLTVELDSKILELLSE